jgi:hypothetical protein
MKTGMKCLVAACLVSAAVVCVGVLGAATCFDDGPCTGCTYDQSFTDYYFFAHQCYPIPWTCVSHKDPSYGDCRETCKWKVYDCGEEGSCWDKILDVTVCYQ